MVKITSKLYRPDNLLDVIAAMEKIVQYGIDKNNLRIEPNDIVIELRKLGYKIVKVDDGI